MDLNSITVDLDLEEEGVWFDYDDETKVKVARSNCKAYRVAVAKIIKPYKRKIRNGTIKGELFDKLIGKAMGQALLNDWKGLKENGVEIPYSREEAVRILTDKKYRDFKSDIADFSDDAEAFRKEEIEEDLGNSEAGSDGT